MGIRQIIEMFKRINEHWFRRRGKVPVLVRRTRIDRTASDQVGENEVEPEVIGPEYDGILEDALNDYATPRHQENDLLDFVDLSKQREVLRRLVRFERRHGAMDITNRQSRVLVVSGLAARPEEVKCRCSKCRKYDVLVHLCTRCGRAFCSRHSYRLMTPRGVLVLCPRDYWREVAQYDTWAAVDACKGNGSSVPIIPERPFSANGYASSPKGTK